MAESRKTTAKSTDRSSGTRPVKKSAAKKTAAKKTAAKKTAAERTTSRRDQSASADRSRKPGASEAANAAARQLLELTGRESEGVTGLEKTDDGWRVQVEVVEVRRIPDTTDMLGLYQVEVDSDGELVGYRRVDRYTRGQSGRE